MSMIPRYKCNHNGCRKEADTCLSFDTEVVANAHITMQISVFPDKYNFHACTKNHMLEIVAKKLEELTYKPGEQK